MNQSCAFQGCGAAAVKHALCNNHYASIAEQAIKEAHTREQPDRMPWSSTALYVFTRLTDGLIDWYRGLFELKKTDLVSIHLNEAQELAQKGEVERATAALRRASELSPGNPSFNLHLGDLYLREGKYEQALASFEGVLTTEPEAERIRERVGEALCGLGRYEQAIEHLAAAAEKSPERADAYHRLGAALEAAGRTGEAVAAYERAVELAPRDASYLQALGFAHESLGQHEHAVKFFKRALEVER